MIREIVFENNRFEYPDFLFEYLHSYIFKFALKRNVYNHTKLDLKSDNLVEFRATIEQSLRELLKECYCEPSHKNKSKHPSRYQKIHLDNQVYIINFRTDPLGNTSYGIQMLLNWIDEFIK